ncbi:MAG: amidohydrolase family protein [bacterium]
MRVHFVRSPSSVAKPKAEAGSRPARGGRPEPSPRAHRGALTARTAIQWAIDSPPACWRGLSSRAAPAGSRPCTRERGRRPALITVRAGGDDASKTATPGGAPGPLACRGRDDDQPNPRAGGPHPGDCRAATCLYTRSGASAPALLIRDATLLTATHLQPRIERGWPLAGGLITDLGEGDAPAPLPDEQVIDAAGRVITPGLIDTHSHLGVYPQPGIAAHADGNEAHQPRHRRAQGGRELLPQDPAIQRRRGRGPPSRCCRQRQPHGWPLRRPEAAPGPRGGGHALPGAPDGVKMACGENPKRVYGDRGSLPSTRMGSLAAMRERLIAARRYRQRWAAWRAKFPDEKDATEPPPDRDLTLETLAGVLDGTILVHIHCYRADEMLQQLRLAREFGYRVRSFHHAVEAYKIRDVLRDEGVSVSTWADWYGFKIEADDAIEENLALLAEAGVRGILHTDSPLGIQRMNQEAAKAWFAGRQADIQVSEAEALRWLTANPAWALGIDARTGTLEAGKMADLVIWDRSPFSVYARALQVYIDGRLRHDAEAPGAPWSDFEVGR